MSDEVKTGLIQKQPIVALESTIITHGMPFPINLQTAKKVEVIMRQKGVIPATIAVIEGQIWVGLNEQQLSQLAEDSQRGKLLKVSRSDLSIVTAIKGSGGTTVSATSLIANRCGIDIFVTGGIGGVHRGVQNSWDISADLTELGRTPITVICAGVKSILDIPKTLEFLETQGVCVVVFDGHQHNDRSFEFPAFFSRKSGSLVTHNIKSIEDVSQLILQHKTLDMNSGIVVAVPIPEEYQSNGETVNNAINEALNEVKQKNILGKDVTPYVLERVNQLSAGSSLTANIALIENNARIGAEIAVQYQRLIKRSTNTSLNALKPTIGLNNVCNDSKQTFIALQSSKASFESIEDSKKQTQESTERNDNQSEELSPVCSSHTITPSIDSQIIFLVLQMVLMFR